VGLASNAVASLGDDVVDPESFETYVIACLVESSLWVVSCVLALVVVLRLTRGALDAELAREGVDPRHAA
jgi:3-deoxy-D-manno-octulosonate 8-phosphate phosphatase KdsC-like HAD superfamily phosphatase